MSQLKVVVNENAEEADGRIELSASVVTWDAENTILWPTALQPQWHLICSAPWENTPSALWHVISPLVAQDSFHFLQFLCPLSAKRDEENQRTGWFVVRKANFFSSVTHSISLWGVRNWKKENMDKIEQKRKRKVALAFALLNTFAAPSQHCSRCYAMPHKARWPKRVWKKVTDHTPFWHVRMCICTHACTCLHALHSSPCFACW